MIREEYLRRLVDQSYLDLYLSATDGARLYWPWRMQPVHEAGASHRNACERYIVDSSFSRDDITNADVLDTGARLDAEAVVLADVWHDIDATVDALVSGVEQYHDHRFDGDVILPLQPPHAECYKRLREHGLDGGHIYAIGGVKDDSDRAKIRATQAVYDIASADAHLHGLGFGLTDELIDAVQRNPDLLDSIDYSTPVQAAMDGTVDAGDERMSVVAARAGAQLVEDLRRVTPYPDAGATRRTTIAEF